MEAESCPRCGAPAPVGAARCASCSNPLAPIEPAARPAPTDIPPDGAPSGQPPIAAGSMADPERAWVPPGAQPDRTAAEPSPEQASRRPRRRRWGALAAAGVLMLGGVLLAVLASERPRGEQPTRQAAAAGTTPTSTAARATGQQRLRAPDTLAELRRFDAFDGVQLPPGAAGNDQVVAAGYATPDGRTGVLLLASRPGADIEAPEETAKFWAAGPDGSRAEFRPFLRDGLDIRCAESDGGAVCYLDGPDLAAVMNGSLPADRMADLLAEAHRKLTG
jgi:hypothetical protein